MIVKTIISHEFKTPLNIILSGTQLLIKTLEHDEKINKDYILKYLNISKQNSYRILRIINNVLDTTVFSFTIM
ncbi:histidine kinase dimerization/phospho-acceptor domain-containing protein, partial [Clostridium perfringens]